MHSIKIELRILFDLEQFQKLDNELSKILTKPNIIGEIQSLDINAEIEQRYELFQWALHYIRMEIEVLYAWFSVYFTDFYFENPGQRSFRFEEIGCQVQTLQSQDLCRVPLSISALYELEIVYVVSRFGYQIVF